MKSSMSEPGLILLKLSTDSTRKIYDEQDFHSAFDEVDKLLRIKCMKTLKA